MNKIISLLLKVRSDALYDLTQDINDSETSICLLRYFRNQSELGLEAQDKIGRLSTTNALSNEHPEFETAINVFRESIEWKSQHRAFLVNSLIEKQEPAQQELIAAMNASDWAGVQAAALKSNGLGMIAAACYGQGNNEPVYSFLREVYKAKPDIIRWIMLFNLNYALKLIKESV